MFDRQIPAVVDDPVEVLPGDLPQADLLVYVGQDRKLPNLFQTRPVMRVKEVIARGGSPGRPAHWACKPDPASARRRWIPATFASPFRR